MATKRASGSFPPTQLTGRPAWVHLNALAVIALALAVLAACAGGNENENGTGDADGTGQDLGAQPENESEPIQIVVTMPFLPSMVEAVGGDQVAVESIVPQGADAHTYQPTPDDAQVIAAADLIIQNGLGLEEFLEDLIESAGDVDAPVVELASGLEDAAIQGGDHDHSDDEHEDDDQADDEDEDDHGHEEGNPHLWLNPEYGIAYVEAIAEALVDIDPDNEDAYRDNAEDYIAGIEEFDEWAREEVSGIPDENRMMVTVHDAYPYFAEHYDLDVVGVVVSSPGREPGTREVTELVDRIRETSAPAVFIEPQFNPDLAGTIAEEAGVEVVEIYSDTPPEGAGYLEMLEVNVERVVEGLS